MTAVADLLLSVVGQNRVGLFCVTGVANPFRCVPDAFLDVLVRARHPCRRFGSCACLGSLGRD
eukprot:157935-Karenia_brevis.AAC.1